MIQITWVEIFLGGWIAATLALSVGFCMLHYKRFRMTGTAGFPDGCYTSGLRQPPEPAK